MVTALETLAIGDEILAGTISDTNSTFVARELLNRQILISRQSVISDTIDAIQSAVTELSARARVIICFGGLGPTSDDRTVEALAAMLGKGIVEDKDALEKIRRVYCQRGAQRGKNVSQAATKQATYPNGTDVIPNPNGLSPGFMATIGEASFFFLPGVPHEMQGMFVQEVLPRIEKMLGAFEPVLTRSWRCIGIWESELQERMLAVEDKLGTHGMLGYRTVYPENHLTLYVKKNAGAALFQNLQDKITKLLERWCYSDCGEELEDVVIRKLKAKGQLLALAESCTGGIVASRLVQVAGASQHFWGSYVSYQIAAKTKMLGIDVSTAYESVSQECTNAMALAAKEQSGANISAAITGYLGPTGSTTNDPVGTIYMSVLAPALRQKRIVLSPHSRLCLQHAASCYLLKEIADSL